jgi:hypothetical protein
MPGNSVIEDPGIPLVTRHGGNRQRYVVQVDNDTSSEATSVGIATPSKFDNIGYRLGRRKVLLNRRRLIVNIEFTLAMVGILFMLVETELFIRGVITKSSIVSIVLKSLISVTTLALFGAVIAYHVTGVDIRRTENGIDHWRLAAPMKWTIFKVILELVVCAIHPLPVNILGPVADPELDTRYVPIDAALSILMLARVYLVARVLVVHSKLLTDTAIQTLGALNKVKIDTVFVFKALIADMPGTVLIILMVAIFVLNSWAMRACEFHYHPTGNKASSILNAMWVTSITFLTVGYGDIYPISYCGRVISIFTALWGVGSTALLIAVLASKLGQTRAEKYLHNFVTRAQIDKKWKNACSDVIKSSIRLWIMSKRGTATNWKRIRVSRELINSMTDMREARTERATVGESCIGITELSIAIRDVLTVVEQVNMNQTALDGKLVAMENSLAEIHSKLNAMHASTNI